MYMRDAPSSAPPLARSFAAGRTRDRGDGHDRHRRLPQRGDHDRRSAPRRCSKNPPPRARIPPGTARFLGEASATSAAATTELGCPALGVQRQRQAAVSGPLREFPQDDERLGVGVVVAQHGHGGCRSRPAPAAHRASTSRPEGAVPRPAAEQAGVGGRIRPVTLRPRSPPACVGDIGRRTEVNVTAGPFGSITSQACGTAAATSTAIRFASPMYDASQDLPEPDISARTWREHRPPRPAVSEVERAPDPHASGKVRRGFPTVPPRGRRGWRRVQGPARARMVAPHGSIDRWARACRRSR